MPDSLPGSRPSFEVGGRVQATLGPIAHGGHVIARVPDRAAGPDAAPVVFFVRHGIPGERATLEITEVERRFVRADVVEVLEGSVDRVAPPCAVAGPGGCGGCDFQHVALPRQRSFKADVIAEQFRRLAGLDVDVEVEAVPGDDAGLRWRSRMQYVPVGSGLGLRKHRSHDPVPVTDCLIAAPDARVVIDGLPSSSEVVTETVLHRSFEVASDGFWQVHPGAPATLVEAVLAALEPKPGERAFDLYGGVGLFAAFLAEAVGAAGSVVSVESDRRASDLAIRNLRTLPSARAQALRVDRFLRDAPGAVDLVVLDPPRTGAKQAVVTEIAARAPRAVAYVACDPAALARDTATFASLGYRLEGLRAFDLFPMTHHVECVAKLVRSR